MACSETPGMISITDCLTTLFSNVPILSAAECDTVRLDQASGRILASDLLANLCVPPSDNSAMDGYALAANDLHAGAELTVIGRSLAGQVHDQPLAAGSCLRIMTGAPTPPDCGAVIMQENTELLDDGRIRTLTASEPGNNIRRRGEDISTGSPLLDAGRRLQAADIGLLASQGLTEVSVLRRLRVALLSTGDELVPPGQPLQPGQIYDSNRLMLHSALTSSGFSVIDIGHVADQPEALEAALRRADQQADAIITSGGVSVGEADFVRDVLGRLGDIHLWKVAIKPGKPFAFGRLSQSAFFGLPGNPVSALVTLQQLTFPALRRMQGEQTTDNLTVAARLSKALKKKPGRTDYQRAVLHQDDHGALLVTPLTQQGSAVLTSISRANCYIVLPREQGDVAAGETVSVQPFA
mgnify:CR=1 FL=1